MRIVICALIVSLIGLTACKDKKETSLAVKDLNTIPLNYPNSKKDTTVYDTYLNGKEKVADPYQWLENDKSPETEQWVDQQITLTRAYLGQILYREQIANRLRSLLQYERMSIPRKKGEYFFYEKNDGLQNQSVCYYKKGLDGEEMVFLDPNVLSSEGTTTANIERFSKDKKLVSIGINEAGSDWKTIKIKRIADNQYLDDVIQNVKFSSAAWYKDGFFYSRFPKTPGSKLSDKNEFHSVYYHRLGSSQQQDILVYIDDNPETYNTFEVSEDEQYFILTKSQGTGGNKLYVARATDQLKNIIWKTVIDDFDNKNYIVDTRQDLFYLLTNQQASNNQLVRFNFGQAEDASWQAVIPENEHLLESVSLAGNKIFATYLENASSKVYQFNREGQAKQSVDLPSIGTTGGFNGEDEDSVLYYAFTSFTYPTIIFSYDIANNKSSPFFEPKIVFDTKAYQTQQVWYTSNDGTKIPMFLTYKKGLELNGNNPTYLYAYGGFNINIVPSFSTSILPFLEAGGVYAVPNLRGGGEFGENWHKAGMLINKQNVFDDFIAAAEYLIQEKYTQKGKLAIAGGSNGGLLVGACMTQRPDLYQVALPAVGVMDMLKYHQFTIGWGWATEYGRSDENPQMFAYLKGYSPLHNIKDGIEYPATLVTTADHDDRVVPAHSFKFIATLQEKQTGIHPVLIRIEKDAGHGAGKPINKIIEETADKWAFTFFNMGYSALNQN